MFSVKGCYCVNLNFCEISEQPVRTYTLPTKFRIDMLAGNDCNSHAYKI